VKDDLMTRKRARWLRFYSPNRVRYWFEVARRASSGAARDCPVCGYRGRFKTMGHPPRYDAGCPQCGCLERHRLFHLAVKRLHLLTRGQSVLHFAPEAIIGDIIRQYEVAYQTADITSGRASLVLDIEKISMPDCSVDVVIANHVLEHVNDVVALAELHRILRPGGRLLASVPLIEGWETTYENPKIVACVDRDAHFGQSDHVRYYGRDFRNRVMAAGFVLQEFSCDGAESVRYSLCRGERIFIGTKLPVTDGSALPEHHIGP
jgi:predicted SAM-dependent methyltransferase